MEIIELQERNDLFKKAVQIFWEVWGNDHNYKFYEDAIQHSCSIASDIPCFYVAFEEGDIIGTYALLRNDLNSRQDLCPWLACLFVSSEHRGNEIGSKLLQHGLKEAAKKGYDKLYLSTDLEGYYEKYGWKNSGIVYGVSGGHIKLYEKYTGLK
ncbi:GNAT family N-acetyltransferase [Alteribacter keqinensis]|uniref:N-acetyltransferase n=1 Tax=Alteribacter keqinensis TaxID=2483800 RepID=A0A3M7TR71_9BACI|nr:GNAT family N-acetyltransferase [Alteribacter keqinensis]RNA67679.1 N-acetyltransferase [Alteribacter keqinensis]